jgi:hypothetical protein
MRKKGIVSTYFEAMHKPEQHSNQANNAAFQKLTGPKFDVCSLGRRAYNGVVRECQLIAANFISREALVSAVVEKVLRHREHIGTLPGGASWLGYIELLGQQDLKALPEQRRPVPVIAEVMQALSVIEGHIRAFAQELKDPALPNPGGIKPIQAHIVDELKARLNEAIAGPTVQRAELMTLARLFSVAATQQLYLREDRTKGVKSFGHNADSIIAKHRATEGYIDEIYGRCALPLPFFDHLPFSSFRKIEGTGIVPLGLTAGIQHVDGTTLEPDRFFEHDKDHFFNRMRERNNALTVGITLSVHAPVDMALYQGIDSALAFSEVLNQQIDTLPDTRSKTLAEAIVFYILREERKVYGILDFNAEQIKRRATSIVRQASRPDTSTSTNPYWDLVRRLSNSADLGQAFRIKPSAEEVSRTLAWIATTL